MVPIHDTDVAEERFVQAQWRNFELWEKIELRLKKKKKIWIIATLILFLALSSIPVFLDRAPAWMATSIARRFAQNWNELKVKAGQNQQAYLIELDHDGSPGYNLYQVQNCLSGSLNKSDRKWISQVSLLPQGTVAQFKLPDAAQASKLSLGTITSQFCYDPLDNQAGPNTRSGFVVLPTSDIENRIDRVGVVLIDNQTSEVKFE